MMCNPPLSEAMHKAWCFAAGAGPRPTHWLMTGETLTGLRAESDGRHGSLNNQFCGLTIYVDEDVPAPGWALMRTPVADRHRERELRDQLHLLYERYRDEARSLIDELVKIEARKPPRPYIIPVPVHRTKTGDALASPSGETQKNG